MAILRMSFTGAVMVLVIAILRVFTIHKFPKRVFVLFWGIALLRLLLPVDIPLGFSVYSLLGEEAPFMGMLGEMGKEDMALQATAKPSAMDAGAVLDMGNRSVHMSGWEAVWLAGMILCAVFLTLSYLYWYREFRVSMPVGNEHVSEWLKNHRLKRPILVRQSGRISAPLTYGILRPVILMPKGIDWDNEKQLECVLLHEYMHIRHNDMLLKLIAATALCVHWFNPMVWLLYILFNRDIELACDERVVGRLGEGARALYARTLILMEEKKSGLMPICNHFSKNAIEERITAIMKSKRTTIGTLIVCTALFIAIAALFAAFPGRKNPSIAGGQELFGMDNPPDTSRQGLFSMVISPDANRQMLFCMGKMYVSAQEDVSKMVAAEAEISEYDSPYIGIIKSSVGNSEMPEQELQSNFGYEGSEVIFNGSGIAVNMDGKWIQFLPEGADLSVSTGFGNLIARLTVSIAYSDGSFSFTIPESGQDWNILINGRYEMDGFGGMGTHFLQEISESSSWEGGETYSFPVDAASLTELYMVVSIGDESEVIDLMEYLPKNTSQPAVGLALNR